MNNIGSLLTSALEAYLIGLIYRNTRTSCRSLARLCARMSQDTLRRVLSSRLGFVAKFPSQKRCAIVLPEGYGARWSSGMQRQSL